MSGEYLWDKQDSDAEVEKLEQQLGDFEYRGQLPDLPPRRQRRAWLRPLLLAAAFVLTAGAVTVGVMSQTDHHTTEVVEAPRQPTKPPAPKATWGVTPVSGAPSCGAVADTASPTCASVGALAVGEWLETDEGSRARLEVADIGFMDVEPRTRIQLRASGTDEHRLHLAHGTIHASVLAPPRLLVVETAAATAVDLGCEYTLEVDDEGNGQLAVSSGWVALELPGRASYVPAGARAQTRRGHDPGTPHFDDAPAPLREALERIDFGDASGALDPVLEHSRVRDTLSLWHLLSRLEGGDRQRVYQRIVELVPSVAELDPRDAVLRLEPAPLERLRDTLEPSWG